MSTPSHRPLRPKTFVGFVRTWVVCCFAIGGWNLAFAQTSSQERQLGRIFMTPQQRQELNRRRDLNIQETAVVVENLYTVSGQVSRSSGKSTTWINGTPQNDAYRPQIPAIIPLRPVEDEASVSVKVGQTFEKNSGSIKDSLPEGFLRITPGFSPARK